jgi:hypothetical protein
VFCIQRRKGVKKKNKHPTILKIPDRLWDKIKSILPKEKPQDSWWSDNHTIQKSDRWNSLCAKNRGCQWKMLPKEYGSGSTCHRRFQQWNSCDIFKKGWIRLLKIYDDCIGINWTWQSIIDSISIKSPLMGR